MNPQGAKLKLGPGRPKGKYEITGTTEEQAMPSSRSAREKDPSNIHDMVFPRETRLSLRPPSAREPEPSEMPTPVGVHIFGSESSANNKSLQVHAQVVSMHHWRVFTWAA